MAEVLSLISYISSFVQTVYRFDDAIFNPQTELRRFDLLWPHTALIIKLHNEWNYNVDTIIFWSPLIITNM